MQRHDRQVSLCCAQDACRPQAHVMHGCLSCWRICSNVGASKRVMLQACYWRPRLHWPESHWRRRAFCSLNVSIEHILQKSEEYSGQAHRRDVSQASRAVFCDTARSAQGGQHSPWAEGKSLASRGQSSLQGVTPGAHWRGKLGMGLHMPWMLNGCTPSRGHLMTYNCHSQDTKVNGSCCCCSQAC